MMKRTPTLLAMVVIAACLGAEAAKRQKKTVDASETTEVGKAQSKGRKGAKDGVQNSAQIEFHERIQYVGIAARHPERHVWGCSPVKCDNGKYHLYGACFVNPFRIGWRTDSYIAHFESDTPQGPFEFDKVVYAGERKQPGEWNHFGICNPCIAKVDGKYALFFIANSNKSGHSPKNQTIGMMTADSPYGPWSVPKQVLTPSPDPKHWTHDAGTGVCNPAFVRIPNGPYYLYFKAAGKETGMRYGVAIADKLEGPYVPTDAPVTDNKELIEDATAFIWNGKVCLITTDNHGNVFRGGGAFWESDDGLKFGPPKIAYFRLGTHVTKEQYPRSRGVKGKPSKGGGKIVRPQILMEDRRPAWLYAPSTECYEGRKYSDCLVFRILTDEEVMERRSKKDR